MSASEFITEFVEVQPAVPAQEGDEFARLEIMGHRTRIGRIEEIERFGAKFLRVHSIDDSGDPRVEDYAGASIFSSVEQVPKIVVDTHYAILARRRLEEERYREERRSRALLTAPDDKDDEELQAHMEMDE